MDRRDFLTGSLVLGAGMMFPNIRVVAAEGGILKLRTNLELPQLDPAYYQSATGVLALGIMYPKLMGFKTNTSEWGWQLEDAEEVTQIDPTHVRFKLRDGMRWAGDFGEVTAEDVKFSFERIVDPQLNSPMRPDFGPLTHVDIEDRRTGVLVFSEPFAPLYASALCYGVGHIVCKAATEAMGKKDFFGMKPPASGGPYKFKEWRLNEVTIFEVNQNWNGKKQAFKEVRLYPIPDKSAAEIAFESGAVDFSEIAPTSLQRYKDSPPAGVKFNTYPGPWYMWLGMNTTHPKLSDLRVRQAIQYGINAKQAVDAVYLGFAPIATGPVMQGVLGWREKSLIPPEGDVPKARKLLQEAGVSSLELTLLVRNVATQISICQFIQAQLAQLGINIKINIVESASYKSFGNDKAGPQSKDLQLFIELFSNVPDPYYSLTWFTSKYSGLWNWQRISTPRYDELDLIAMRETNLEKRAQMYYEMQDILDQTGAYRFLTYELLSAAYRDPIKPALRPDGLPRVELFTSV
jgi:peptide/nickel transport system substrate-binding protein